MRHKTESANFIEAAIRAQWRASLDNIQNGRTITMITRTLGKIATRLGFVVLATGILATAGSASAFAATCAPNIVEYNAPTGTTFPLLIQCSPTNYVGLISATGGCPAQSVDTLKIWASLAQAAVLSGKKLNIYTTTCGSTSNVITAIDLVQ
jgi:hypothetical protein